MGITRRTFLNAAGAVSFGSVLPSIVHAKAELRPEVAIRSPWMANQVALTRDNLLFLGLPRYAKDKPTPSLARRDTDGTLKPFPGNTWNEWLPGKDASEAFVYLNSVHIFADDTVWCVDQGSLSPGIFGPDYATPAPGAQKIVELDPHSGSILKILRFDEDILPPGSQMNDLRFHGNFMYVTDSGLGGLIVHDMATGKTIRRLSGQSVVKASKTNIPNILANIKGSQRFVPPNSDMVEVTADGKWIYWASPTGPLYRVQTEKLRDSSIPDTELASMVERASDIAFSGGCSMDSLGNIYFSETISHQITVLSPSGKKAVLLSDPTIVRPDGSFISADRYLYIPIKQPIKKQNLADQARPELFVTYSVRLPDKIDDIKLGSAINGAPSFLK